MAKSVEDLEYNRSRPTFLQTGQTNRSNSSFCNYNTLMQSKKKSEKLKSRENEQLKNEQSLSKYKIKKPKKKKKVKKLPKKADSEALKVKAVCLP